MKQSTQPRPRPPDDDLPPGNWSFTLSGSQIDELVAYSKLHKERDRKAKEGRR